MPTKVEKSKEPLILLLLLLVFVGSRVIVRMAGVNFDVSAMGVFWQYLDIPLLRDNLIESIYYQHSQPPLFSLFLGLNIKLFPQRYPEILQLFYALFGLAIYISMYKILRINRFGIGTSFGIATMFILSPEAILYENWPFYTWPVATLLVLSAYALFKYEKVLSTKHAALFLFGISIICLTRSAFHLGFMIACMALIVLINNSNRRIIAVVSTAAFSLVALLFLKNLLVFGFFGSSSWMGMNLWKIAENENVPILVAENKISDIASVPIFTALSNYPEEYAEVPERFQDIPTLANEYKENGEPNFNHIGYIELSEEYQKASVYLISHDFTGYLKRVVKAWGIYSSPAWNYWFLEDNALVISDYIHFITIAQPRFKFEEIFLNNARPYNFPLSSLLVIPLALLVVLVGFILRLPKLIKKDTSQQLNGSFIFLVMTIFYIALLGNSLETGENNRFRVMTDPLLLVAVVISARDIMVIGRQKIPAGRTRKSLKLSI